MINWKTHRRNNWRNIWRYISVKQVILHNKPIKKIADKNKSASNDILTHDNVDTNENEKSDEEQKKYIKK